VCQHRHGERFSPKSRLLDDVARHEGRGDHVEHVVSAAEDGVPRRWSVFICFAASRKLDPQEHIFHEVHSAGFLLRGPLPSRTRELAATPPLSVLRLSDVRGRPDRMTPAGCACARVHDHVTEPQDEGALCGVVASSAGPGGARAEGLQGTKRCFLESHHFAVSLRVRAMYGRRFSFFVPEQKRVSHRPLTVKTSTPVRLDFEEELRYGEDAYDS